jgi:hypothetical protein
MKTYTMTCIINTKHTTNVKITINNIDVSEIENALSLTIYSSAFSISDMHTDSNESIYAMKKINNLNITAYNDCNIRKIEFIQD